MNKKAEAGGILKDNVIFLILLLVFLGLIFIFIQSQMNGASLWEDYYAKEISRVINSAEPGDEITLDIQKATEIALDNQVRSFSEIFIFDNTQNEICVKLSPGKKSCYFYFNNVDIIEPEIKLGVPQNILFFKIEKKPK